MYAFLGDIQLGLSNIMTGPVGSDESLANTINEHAVLRGKPVPQIAGEELDLRNFSFFFDETFCTPQAEYAKLRAARSSHSILPLVMGNGIYIGKSYAIQNIDITWLKTTPGGSLVRLEADIALIEMPGGGLSIGGGVAGIARAILNPFTRR